jgi:hypothetical protein
LLFYFIYSTFPALLLILAFATLFVSLAARRPLSLFPSVVFHLSPSFDRYRSRLLLFFLLLRERVIKVAIGKWRFSSHFFAFSVVLSCFSLWFPISLRCLPNGRECDSINNLAPGQTKHNAKPCKCSCGVILHVLRLHGIGPASTVPFSPPSIRVDCRLVWLFSLPAVGLFLRPISWAMSIIFAGFFMGTVVGR